MFIKNIKTGLVQECSNKDVIKICQKDVENYEVTAEKPVISKDNSSDKAPEAEAPQEPGKNLEEMKVAELKALAKEKGIEGSSSLSREDLLSVLKDVE
ncbi:Rho termination factor N-terminal domain-containing protein [Lachnospiraceae bacterium 54-53]